MDRYSQQMPCLNIRFTANLAMEKWQTRLKNMNVELCCPLFAIPALVSGTSKTRLTARKRWYGRKFRHWDVQGALSDNENV